MSSLDMGEAIRMLANEKNIQAAAVIKMYRTQGRTYQEIADHLNNSHFRTVRGKTFSKAMVRYLWLRD